MKKHKQGVEYTHAFPTIKRVEQKKRSKPYQKKKKTTQKTMFLLGIERKEKREKKNASENARKEKKPV